MSFLLVGLAMASVRPSHGCSITVSVLGGAIGRDGEVVYLPSTGDEERPGTYRWLRFAAGGTLVAEQEIAIPWADVSVDPVLITEAGSLWLRVRCHRAQNPGYCDVLQEVTADGSLGRRAPLPPRQMRLWVEGEQVRYSSVDAGVLELWGIDLEHATSRLLRRLDLGDRYPLSGQGVTWGFGPDDEVVLTFDQGEQDVVLVRLDADGNEVARAQYPRARSGFEPVDDDGVRRLGPFWHLTIGADGVVAAAQSGNDSSCHRYQPPSVALFAKDLSRLGVADNDGFIRSLRRVGKRLVVLGANGTVRDFALDGTLLDTWSPEAAFQNDPATQWQGRWEEMEAAAAALEQGSPLAARVSLYDIAEEAKRAEIDAWWVEEGPRTYAALGDAGWQELAARLCVQHPIAAPAEALRRYDRSRGAQQEEWLEAVVACFEQPITRVYEHVVAVASDRTARVDFGVVFRVWGYPHALLDGLWAAVLDTPLTRPTDVREEANRLLEAFPQTAETFDRLLTSGSPVEQQRVRRILLETIYVWGSHYDYREESLRTARAALVRWADRWSASDQRDVAETGRLLRLGHLRAEDHPPRAFARRVAELVDAARREPRVWPWLALALDEAITDEATFELLGDETADWLVGASQEASPYPLGRFMLDYGAPDPWGFVLDHGGIRSLRMLVAFAMTDRARPAMRNRLLRQLTEKPWTLDVRIMHRLLEAPWLTEKGVAATGLVARLGSVARRGGPLQQTLVRRLSELFAWFGPDARYGTVLALYDPTIPLQGSPLIDALGMDGVRAIHDRTDETYPLMRLIARVGAWPVIASRVEPLLAGPANNVRIEAAAALATNQHPEAFEILLHHVEAGYGGEVEIEALRHYGEAARAPLRRLLADENAHVRARARLALRAVGPREEEVEALATVANAAFDRGELPDGATLLMLHEAGHPVFSRLVATLEDEPKLRLGGIADHLRHDLHQAFLSWLQTSAAASPELPPALGEILPFVTPEARHWLAELESSFAGP